MTYVLTSSTYILTHYTLWIQWLDVLCTCMAMFSQSDYSIVFKFHQHQYVTILFNPNDQDLNMNFTKSSDLETIY